MATTLTGRPKDEGGAPAVPTIWTNSSDSHYLEPADLFTSALPARLAALMPRSEPDGDAHELIHVEGRVVRRRVLSEASVKMRELVYRARGARDVAARLEDLDGQGVWGEVVFPSLGLWCGEIRSAELVAAAARVLNDYIVAEMRVSPRFVPTAVLPYQSVGAALAELERCAGLGFLAFLLTTNPPEGSPFWNDDHWAPVWAAAEASGMVAAVHIGTDGGSPVKFRGPGGALVNYVETTFGPQRAVAGLVAAGVLERHPALRVLVAEGGATWVPFLGDRMNECYRQQPMFHDGRLAEEPKAYVMRQVYASFQHDETAVPTLSAMGYRNVTFGTDYPHLEGTYPRTQEVLHELFDGQPDEVRRRITLEAFLELFPRVGLPPQG